MKKVRIGRYYIWVVHENFAHLDHKKKENKIKPYRIANKDTEIITR